VFQTDTDVDKMKPPAGAGKTAWKAFLNRASGGPLFFDLRIDGVPRPRLRYLPCGAAGTRERTDADP
jgi:hypothetical protein